MFKGKYILASVLLLIGAIAGTFQACAPGRLMTSTALSISEPQTGHAVAVQLAGSQPRLGDHSWMASSFLSIFGSSAEVAAIVNTEISSHISIFGGRCDRYLGNCASDVTGEYLTSLGSNSVLREAYKIRACDRILTLSSNAGLTSAISQISGASLTVSPNDQTLANAYNLFNPSLEMPEQNLISYKWLLTRSSDPLVQWQLVITVLCHDPNWEMP